MFTDRSGSGYGGSDRYREQPKVTELRRWSDVIREDEDGLQKAVETILRMISSNFPLVKIVVGRVEKDNLSWTVTLDMVPQGTASIADVAELEGVIASSFKSGLAVMAEKPGLESSSLFDQAAKKLTMTFPIM